jgi:hypothetical protein
VSVGRKNWLHTGSDDGGRRMAILYTLVQTAKLHGAHVEHYLAWLLGQLGRREWSVASARALLPDRWAEQQAAKERDAGQR